MVMWGGGVVNDNDARRLENKTELNGDAVTNDLIGTFHSHLLSACPHGRIPSVRLT